jgi:hypothetical protein
MISNAQIISKDSAGLMNQTKKMAKKNFKITGGYNLSSILYFIQGSAARRDPFYWVFYTPPQN